MSRDRCQLSRELGHPRLHQRNPSRRLHVEPILFRRSQSAEVHGAQLRELLGATRLSLLRHLGTPHTTAALAQVDHHAAATISHHLGVLRRAGLVTGRRSGRSVLDRRTALGEVLFAGELPATAIDLDAP